MTNYVLCDITPQDSGSWYWGFASGENTSCLGHFTNGGGALFHKGRPTGINNKIGSYYGLYSGYGSSFINFEAFIR